MWFTFPQGYDRISVQQQQFEPEAEDDDGRKYFRAPDHFAPLILAIKGFAVAAKPPEGAPADLPQADPLRDSAISLLTRTGEALKLENANLRSDLAAATARITALVNEKAVLAAEVDKLKERVAILEEEAEDKPLDLPKKGK